MRAEKIIHTTNNDVRVPILACLPVLTPQKPKNNTIRSESIGKNRINPEPTIGVGANARYAIKVAIRNLLYLFMIFITRISFHSLDLR